MNIRESIEIIEQNLMELMPYKNDEKVRKFKQMTGHIDPSIPSNMMRHKSALTRFKGFLKRKGFAPYGNGAFGLVFSHPNLDYVIKVFKDNKGYNNFVEECMNGHLHSSPNVPKFIGKIMTIDDRYHLVRMEKLAPVRTKVFKNVIDFIDTLRRKNILTIDGYDEIKEKGSFHYFEDEDLQAVCNYIDTQPELIPTMDWLSNMGEKFDLHSGNFMLRGSTLVVTDPFM